MIKLKRQSRPLGNITAGVLHRLINPIAPAILVLTSHITELVDHPDRFDAHYRWPNDSRVIRIPRRLTDVSYSKTIVSLPFTVVVNLRGGTHTAIVEIEALNIPSLNYCDPDLGLVFFSTPKILELKCLTSPPHLREKPPTHFT